MTRIFTRLALATLATTCSTAALAQASTQADAQASTPNDEIVVTAQKREQRIADVPVTVTAVTGARRAS